MLLIKQILRETMENSLIIKVKQTNWFKALNKQGEVLFVGGLVRDELLGKISKDVDILIKGLSLNDITKILDPFGEVLPQNIGGKLAMLKFKPKNWDEELIDIVIPRIEKPIGDKHTDFDITVDKNLPLEKDLERRDFTINAIGKTSDGKLFDPFGGKEDLKNKVLRAVSQDTFSDDPLRMIRGVQFASRFGFDIEPKTLALIKKNASKIKVISGERILGEFEKIILKGNATIALKLLNETGLFENIFGFKWSGDVNQFKQVKTLGEFAFLLLQDHPTPHVLFMNRLKGDLDTAKEIEALKMADKVSNSKPHNRMLASKMLAKSKRVKNSKIIPSLMQKAIKDITTKYPIGLSELDVNGEDLKLLGFQGKALGDKLQSLLMDVYSDKVINKKEQLLK